MNRLRRAALAALTAAGLVSAAPAQGASSLAYVFVVDCANPSGTTSLVDLPSGTYAVTIAGACSYGTYDTTSVSTCVGWPVPCTGPVSGVPRPWKYSTGGVGVNDCAVALNPPCWLYVQVDGQCVAGNAGTIRHAGTGSMVARFVDCACYADNYGAFVVTVTWTPL